MEFGYDVHQQVIDEKSKSKSNNNGSGLSKQERSDPFEDEGNRVSKMGKRVDEMGLRSDNNNSNKEQMLSFSSDNKPEVVGFISADDVRLVSDNKNGLSFYHHQNSSTTSAGFSSGNMNGGMHGSLTGIRGPFTPAQWIELEHQAMIYKYFTANVPVPSDLLIPIQKAIQSAGFGFSIGSFPSHTYGWGSLHLGFSSNSDPEPGRCRRTDGKKWRCSRDAVPDQKYCERHINRGRHRSRKPVESQTGQAVSGAATTKVLPPMPASMPSLVKPGGGVPNGVAIAQHQIKGLQPSGVINASTGPITKRLNDQQGLSVMPSTLTLESKNSQYPNPKHLMVYDESSVLEFGIVSNDSLLNPSQKSSYMDCKSYNTLLEFNNPKNQDQYPPQHLMDNWPKDQPHRSANPWPENPKSDWTELSMSIPMSADFSLSSASPNQDKPCASPSRLSRESDPSHMGLGVGTIVTEEGTRQNSWIPIAYGNARGGPLGEVLLNNTSDGINIGERWDRSPQLGSSPTGVLQKSTFVSLSNSGSPLGHV